MCSEEVVILINLNAGFLFVRWSHKLQFIFMIKENLINYIENGIESDILVYCEFRCSNVRTRGDSR